MGRVCAIVPTFNRASYLTVALASIMRQSCPVDEIIVVNDGSTDNTLQVLAAYEGKVSVYTQKNAGKAAAMNLGLSKATADYIWFCDDDDLAADDGLAPLVDALDSDPDLDFVYGSHQEFADDRVNERRMPDFWGLPRPDQPLLNIIGNLYPYQGATLVRRRLFDQIGNFNTDFARCQDVEMMIRMALHGKSIFVPHIVFYQRGHSGARYVFGRGPVTATEAITRAVIFDQKALLLHQHELTLDRVTPIFAQDLPEDIRRRSAHLHRSSMFARRAMWPQAIDDLEAAIRASSTPALPKDLERLAFCVVNPQMCDLLRADAVSMKRLRQLYTGSTLGKAIVAAMLRPMPWHIRTGFISGRMSAGWSRVALASSILGVNGLMSLVIDKKLN